MPSVRPPISLPPIDEKLHKSRENPQNIFETKDNSVLDIHNRLKPMNTEKKRIPIKNSTNWINHCICWLPIIKKIVRDPEATKHKRDLQSSRQQRQRHEDERASPIWGRRREIFCPK